LSDMSKLMSSVRIKVFLTLIVIVLFQAGFLILYVQESQERQIEMDAQQNVALSLSRLQGTLEYLFKRNDLVQVREEVAVLGVEEGIRSAFIVDEKKNIVASIKVKHVDEPIEAALADWSVIDKKSVIDFVTTAVRNKTWISDESQSVIGVFPLIIDSQGDAASIKNNFLVLQYDLIKSKYAAADLIYHVLASQVFLVLIAALLIHLLVTRRVAMLRRATEEIFQKNYSYEIDIAGHDEIADLGRSLNMMSKRIFFDVTESKKIQDALRRSEETYAKAEEIAHIGSWDWDILTGDLRWTDEIFRIFGQEPQSFGATYDAFLESIHEEDRDKVVNAVNASVGDASTEYNVEHRVVRANTHEVRVVQERGKVYRDQEGAPVRMIGTVYDITEQRAAEKELDAYRERLEDIVEERTAELKKTQVELVRSERLATLGQLTATVSHELRNPLGAMRPSLYVIKRKMPEGDVKLDDAVKRIDRNIDRCDHIIDELLDFTRITVLDKQEVEIRTWLDSVLNDVAIPEKVNVVRHYEESEMTVLLDRGRFRRAIINVVDNAYQAALEKVDNEKPRIEIAVVQHDDRVCFSIIDNGIGMPDDVRERIFEPLFSTKGFGVGLGMPTVHQIMEQHQGGIEIESTPGKGTSVMLWIPLSFKEDIPEG